MRRREFIRLTTSIIIIATFGFAVGELALRLKKQQMFTWRNEVKHRFSLALNSCAVDYDPTLGWAPAPTKSGLENRWGTSVHITAEGFRANRSDGKERPASDHPSVLAIGDSFTFGDQVEDHESWPAQLEKLSGQRVLNAGVCGYGIDQAVMRALAVAPKYEPETLIISLIGPDLERASWRVYRNTQGTPKPYFEIVNGELSLRNVPVPRSTEFDMRMTFWHRILGYSLLADKVLLMLVPKFWDSPLTGRVAAQLSGFSGADIGCELMKKLAKIAVPQKTRVLIVAQDVIHEKKRALDDSGIDQVGACAKEAGLEWIDTRQTLDEIRKSDPHRYYSLFVGQAHMSAKGNSLIAKILLDRLTQ